MVFDKVLYSDFSLNQLIWGGEYFYHTPEDLPPCDFYIMFSGGMGYIIGWNIGVTFSPEGVPMVTYIRTWEGGSVPFTEQEYYTNIPLQNFRNSMVWDMM